MVYPVWEDGAHFLLKFPQIYTWAWMSHKKKKITVSFLKTGLSLRSLRKKTENCIDPCIVGSCRYLHAMNWL